MTLLAERVNSSSGLADLPVFTDELTCGTATAPTSCAVTVAVVVTVVAGAYVAGYAAGYAAGHGTGPHPH